ncbi:hypothetical protein JT359_03470 [Candidatus Poribacteria bacterium]|nr:hypothetical protein [Candidatus Poribacteria bacterium]
MRHVILLALIFCVSPSYSEILFEENFESGNIDKDKWTPQGTWVIKDNADDHDELGKHVIEIQGGDVGLSVEDFPKEFDYYADFKAMQNGLTGFVFHGQDAGNIYMHQVSTSSSGHTPQHIRWHRRVGGGWTAEPGAFKDGEDRDPNVWYRVKFEVRTAYKFKAYIGPVGGENDDLSFVSEWTDSQKSFTDGKIGFRMSGGEQAQYDNIVVSTPDFDIFSVEPTNKLAMTWGSLKSK